mgnify:CR=1 FL=1
MSDKPMTKTKKLDPAVTDLENFSREMFGLELYPWQIAAMKGITGKGGKSRVAVRAANGSGKTTHLAAPAALWHALIYPNSITITTSGVYRQVKEQMWPCIRSLAGVAGIRGVTAVCIDYKTRTRSGQRHWWLLIWPRRVFSGGADYLMRCSRALALLSSASAGHINRSKVRVAVKSMGA